MPPAANPNQAINVKLLLIGNSSVGKSSLLLRFSDEQWLPEDESSATIGVDFRVSLLHFFPSLHSQFGSTAQRTKTSETKGIDAIIFLFFIGTQDGVEREESEA